MVEEVGVPQMPFTYEAYRDMLRALKEEGYQFVAYGEEPAGKAVILRHDIDNDPLRARRIARIEHEEGARSTFFFLMRSDLYNLLAPRNLEVVREVAALGHDVGLHFDEVLYGPDDDLVAAIASEAALLAGALGGEVPVRSVSMHRPSKAALEGDWQVPGMANSYARTYLEDWEYASDSRRRWRRDVMGLIRSGAPRLHILTHPFWYGELPATLGDDVEAFVHAARPHRIADFSDNFTSLGDVLGELEVRKARIQRLHTMEFPTERLVLRPPQASDLDDFYEYTTDADTCRFVRWGPYTDISQCKAWLDGVLAGTHEDDQHLALVLREEDKVIGELRIYHLLEDTARCSLVLSPLYRGHGYMTEALREAFRICFEELGMPHVASRADVENVGSNALLARAGMTLQPELETVEIRGRTRSYKAYVIDREDW